MIPSFLTRQVSGVLRLRDGETTYIGGLLQTQESEGFRGFAGVPLLSKLLSPTEKKKTTREVIISLTPHLVRAPKVTEDDLVALSTGTEEVVRMRSVHPNRFGGEESDKALETPPGAPATPDSVPPPLEPAPPQAAAPAQPLFGTEPAPAEGQQVIEPAEAEPQAPSVPAGSEIAASISPSERVLPVGEVANLDVVVMSAQDVRVVNLTLRFDPDKVSLTDVAAGSLLTLDGQSVGVQKVIGNGTATVKFTRASGTSGSGSIATLRVQGLQPGNVEVVVQGLTLETGTGPKQPVMPISARLEVQH